VERFFVFSAVFFLGFQGIEDSVDPFGCVCKDGSGGGMAVAGWGVAVVGWGWCQSIEQINAVRMV
jgi:hypothetical protein